ncbi:hypothetical protein CEAHHEIO_00176 [Monkeypox virus]|uniref:Uncharacterized protein n=1 Tax=Monkeypox virus TaxID=10244 RepID=A0A650BUD0_MONPV|nr:hypothetical protein PDLMKLCO_00174 [Monkeypox virus]URK21232.1 hypothetical protein MPXV-SI-2022V502225_00176 [Monkeypox virus]URK21423.1 hypothetical protein MPXV-SI-2022V52144_00176 [Monkeypox virus]URZ86258.1 hypothetical protein CEAHHEIO_00176 [Monkeypox virus]USE04229.1 hypothetical protein MPXV_SI2022_S3_00176 [Monkeypox virus]
MFVSSWLVYATDSSQTEDCRDLCTKKGDVHADTLVE